MAETATLTLTDFLLARISEDEDTARACTNPSWAWADTSGRRTLADMEHVERHSPVRVLAECEAKRQIVGLQPASIQACSAYHPGQDTYHPEGHPNEVLIALAAVYADHPDYNPDWRP